MINARNILDNEIRSLVEIYLKRKVPDTMTFESVVYNPVLITMLIREGITCALFDLIRQCMPFTLYEWAELTGISQRTILNHRLQSINFDPVVSGRIIEVAEAANMGEATFGNIDDYMEWLKVPCAALHNFLPFELLKSSYGKEAVLTELRGISNRRLNRRSMLEVIGPV